MKSIYCSIIVSDKEPTERSPCKEEDSSVFVEWIDDRELLSFSVQGVDGRSTQAEDVLHLEERLRSTGI